MIGDTPGTLGIGEYHPAADAAMAWVQEYRAADPLRWLQLTEAFASTALSGNRLAEICVETINRLNNAEGVSDRYLLGLAWTLRQMEDKK